jgi:hypothetical protein
MNFLHRVLVDVAVAAEGLDGEVGRLDRLLRREVLRLGRLGADRDLGDHVLHQLEPGQRAAELGRRPSRVP